MGKLDVIQRLAGNSPFGLTLPPGFIQFEFAPAVFWFSVFWAVAACCDAEPFQLRGTTSRREFMV
jgi:hypothetical protein